MQLNVNDASCPIGTTIKEAKEIINETDELVIKSANVINNITTNLSEIDDVRKEMEKLNDELHCLETTLQYLRVIQRIEFLR